MNLINALTEGTVEYREDGIVIRHPPNTIMLHASRALKQLADQHETNMLIINSLQNQNQTLLKELEALQNEHNTSNPISVQQSPTGGQDSETSNVES
jgi:hypothetical protein